MFDLLTEKGVCTMHKQRYWFPLLLMMALLLTACGNGSAGTNGNLAQAPVESYAATVIPDEPYEAVPYRLSMRLCRTGCTRRRRVAMWAM